MSPALRVVEQGLDHPPVSDGVPIASGETVVILKLLAGRTQDHADIEAMVAAIGRRDELIAAVEAAVPDRADVLQRLFKNADRRR